MKSLLTFIFAFCMVTWALAQTPMKQIVNKNLGHAQPIQLAEGLPSFTCEARSTTPFSPKANPSGLVRHEAIESVQMFSSGSLWINLKQNDLWSSRTSMDGLMEEVLPSTVFQKDISMGWEILGESKDERNIEHIKIQQHLAGIPILRQDMIVHIDQGRLRDLNGFAWTGPVPSAVPEAINPNDALQACKDFLVTLNVKFQPKPTLPGLDHPEDNVELCWIPVKGKLILAYNIEVHPNMMDHWVVRMDAVTREVIESYSKLCSFHPDVLYENKEPITKYRKPEIKEKNNQLSTSTLLDGPSVTTDQDLAGQNRTVNGYLIGADFFMIDASRSGMFDANQSILPNEPAGVIWTIDGQNGSPQRDDFEVVHVSNTNNNWKNLEVSAHFNAGESYEYFRQSFNRNSLNGSGGNIISIINITDENGQGLDNAFWGGTAMFYGNGNTDYSPLAEALDVAGHEMSHGVIQNTANLEYLGQSGAMNESFADVFGAMIDRDDWRLGEEVVNPAVFPSGALRDLSNPHNGGNNLSDPGWQPNHMNEYQNLPLTPEGDNGGVHVNSGITNRAFFLLATNIGKPKAEQIYYKALRDYLVMSSQFIDLRNAIEKSATDIHGANTAEVIAVRAAFDGVGIGAGQGDDHQDDIDTNSGDDYILATDVDESDLYWIPPGNPNAFVKLDLPAPLSRPSFTDDGTTAVYVDQNNELRGINFDWTGVNLNYNVFFIESNPQGIWRNIVISKDGSKLAYTTAQLFNEIGVFDYNTGNSEVFILNNPTSAEGIETGDVLYADAMEWDYTGEFIMYDALNRIESNFGDGIEFWDISFLQAWDNSIDNFADGQIGKLYNGLPENISIGNPSFAKNSPYIITFDFIEIIRDQFGQEQEDYWVIAANVEAGTANNVFHNTTVGYPSYSRLDDQIVFTFEDNGNPHLLTINMQPADKTLPVPGSEEAFINFAQKAVWFQTGNRDFTSTEDVISNNSMISSWPNPALEEIRMTLDPSVVIEEYTITDLTGRLMRKGKLSDENAIDIEFLLPGTYFVTMRSGSEQLRTKFVKQ